MEHSIIHQSAVDQAELIRTGQISATDVVEAHLDRIAEVNEDVNAIVSMRGRDEILADAAAADKLPATGPLHGLPVAVKDLENVAGLPTRSGSLTTSSEPVLTDGLVARRLRSAGAIIIAKTNTPEFGTGSHTFNDVFGVTRNPWDLSKTAGGSSGGAASALASRMVPIADGSDFGGSLRNPAGFCSVVGLRPSIGRVPSQTVNSTHLLRLVMQGPMGRTVADTALVLSVLAGPEPNDPLSLTEPGSAFAPPIRNADSVRIAWGGDLGLFTAEPDVLRLCREAAGKIEATGGSVEDAHPDMSDAMIVFRVLRGLNYRDLNWAVPPDRRHLLKQTVRDNIDYGMSLEVEDVMRAEQLRAELHREMTRFFDEYDILALPTAQVVPFPVELEYPTEISGKPMADYLEWMTTCCVITPTGCPAISIPAGFNDDGLPVGLQLVARVGHERQLLEVATAIEAAAPYHQQLPPLTCSDTSNG